MKSEDNKELQKQVKDLNLQNGELLKQHNLIVRQMNAMKRQNAALRASSGADGAAMSTDNDTAAMIKGLESMELGIKEHDMSAAELVVHRFAAMEANDLRLSLDQRLRKTAQMMRDLGDDINALMSQWLPKRHNQKNKEGKSLVFSVRQLIGHFNVLVGQKKEAEVDRNKATEALKKKDLRIQQLEEKNVAVFKLQNELKEMGSTLEQLRKERDYYKERVDEEEMEEQTEDAVNQQVVYLSNLMRQRRSGDMQQRVGVEGLEMLASLSNTGSLSLSPTAARNAPHHVVIDSVGSVESID